MKNGQSHGGTDKNIFFKGTDKNIHIYKALDGVVTVN
jgi:hypothetical protein